MPSTDGKVPAREKRLRSRARGPSPGGATVRRGVALALLAGVLAVPAGLSILGDSKPPRLRATPPYRVPSAEGSTRLGRPWDASRDLETAAALVYVSEECRYCRSELGNWDALRTSGEEIPLWIVASRSSEFETLGWVPPALRGRVISDQTGSIADALGVRAVPVTLWIDLQGVVRGQRFGASSPDEIRAEYRTLVDASTLASSPRPPTSDHPSAGGPS